jgi:hypothetical protein
VFAVELQLDLAPALGLRDGRLHRVGDLVGVHQDRPVHVAGGPPDRLDERGVRPEEPLLVGIEDGHQRHLGEVQSLPEQVDPHQDVELSQAKIAEDLDPMQRVDL